MINMAITISDTYSKFSFFILILCIFSGFIIYQIIGIKEDKEIKKKFSNVKGMIEEGHRKALAGRKDDGLYRETKRLKADKDSELFGDKQRLKGETIDD